MLFYGRLSLFLSILLFFICVSNVKEHCNQFPQGVIAVQIYSKIFMPQKEYIHENPSLSVDNEGNE